MLDVAAIEAAAKSLAGVVHKTPINMNATVSELARGDVWLKMENLQRTGSFKVRGAYNRILAIPEADRAKGVVAASAGNHAQGVALGARLAGIPATIVMPKHAPITKAEAVKGYGAALVLHGADYHEAEAKAREIQAETGATFVHAFNDDAVMAGQGTLGLEIIDDLPDVDTVIVPVGGGGLIAGVATAIKSRRPTTRVIGVVPSGAASLPESLKKGELVMIDKVATLADGLATRSVGSLTFPVIQKMVDEVVVVEDDEIASAILLLMERAKAVVEGGGAVGLAAVLAGKVDVSNQKSCIVLSGGNIDVTLLDTIIQRGLIQTGRALNCWTILDDKPGALRDLLALLARLEANVRAIEHDRTDLHVRIGKSRVNLHLDTRGPEHVTEILDALRSSGYPVTVRGGGAF